ncbi:LysR family transcriptional regulator [Arenibaculum pallidiluteum]|uniref:LysR family transcriptional regulator n=1 Tax=Arenibaculum pallidiluteum TaxID=2812559 RepID=UPI001A968524|nr:LysR family transcriptional regulator [Arenibaculum pallidiluteum]
MDLIDGFRALTKAVETGSFSAAARELGVRASSVSRLVAALEVEFGTQLLRRSTRRLSLTEAGLACHERALRVLAEVEEMRGVLAERQTSPQGLLRVNAPVSFGHRHVAPHIPAFLRRYPDLRIDLDLTDHRVDLVEAAADLAIRIGALDEAGLTARRLAPQRRLVCASPDYLREAPPLDAPEDLVRHECLGFHLQPTDLWLLTDGTGPLREIRIAGRMRANTSDALLEAAIGGLGIALLPTWLVAEAIAAGRLVHLLPGFVGRFSRREQGIYGVYIPNRHLSPKVRLFLDHLARAFGRPPYWERGRDAR